MKSLEDIKLNEKKTINDANTEVTEILELFDKDCKTITLKCFSEQLQTQMKQQKNKSTLKKTESLGKKYKT